MQISALIRKNTIFYVYEIINAHLRLHRRCFESFGSHFRENFTCCATLQSMVQEEMSVHAVGDTESGPENPDSNSCRILLYSEDEPTIGVDLRLKQLIHLLDK